MPKSFDTSYANLPLGCRLLVALLPANERSNAAQKITRAMQIARRTVRKQETKVMTAKA